MDRRLPLLLLSMFFVYRLERIRVGRAFIAIREDELAADAMGINPTHYKVLAFTLGAMLAGVVGAVSAHFLNTWNARQGTFDASISYLAFVLIGGSRTFLGPVARRHGADRAARGAARRWPASAACRLAGAVPEATAG